MSPDDHLFRALSHPYRRHAIAALASTNSMTLRDVSNTVVSRTYGAPLTDVPSDAVTDVYLSLVHVHVPLLEDAGLLEYDPHRERIEAVDLEGAMRLLSVVADDRSPVGSAR
ncbi:hypothetical protein Halxa_1782 [Halopiger xanaduensis SH-6]|uniref:DUF7344 domain-containing protein n=1 Tax=Halopiger xanaduensis (strain DSM 18323 / JCM 14033 / SH-6) TaxID=797210 RepID=F8D558_HALXS|nr:hypothetical protein Halxa_1782 [Halopiger xanaduensis SH-6]